MVFCGGFVIFVKIRFGRMRVIWVENVRKSEEEKLHVFGCLIVTLNFAVNACGTHSTTLPAIANDSFAHDV